MGRGRRFSLPQLLDESQSALLVLDERRQIRFVSPGLEQLTGWQPADLLGQICERGAPRSGSLVELLLNSLAPAADAWSGSLQLLDTVVPHRNGTTLTVRLACLPLRHTAVSPAAVLISLQPVPPGSAAEQPRRSVSQQLYAEIHALRLDMRRRLGSPACLGNSPPMRKAARQAELLSQSRAHFVITGPPGSGRRHLARLIHAASHSAESSLAIVSCQLLTTEVLLTTLYQLRQQSSRANSAPHQKTGLLLLTDIDSLPPEAQQWLITHHNPSSGPLWLAATSCTDPRQLRQTGQLLPELADMLTTVEIRLPPLHDRGDDVLLLSQQFVDEQRRDQRTLPEHLAADVQRAFLQYRWPGQVRELRQVLEAACRTARTAELQLSDLPFTFRTGQDAQRQPLTVTGPALPLETLLQTYEAELITSTLDDCQGNKTEAARRLGLTRPKLYRRMTALGLATEDGEP